MHPWPLTILLAYTLLACEMKKEDSTSSSGEDTTIYQTIDGPTPIEFAWNEGEPNIELNYPDNAPPEFPGTTSIKAVPLTETCLQDSSCFLALEREYWQYIARADVDGMNEWILRVKPELPNIKNLEHQGRLSMLTAFGHVQWSRRADNVYMGIPDLLHAKTLVESSLSLLPHSTSAQSLNLFIDGFQSFGFKQIPAAEAAIEKLTSMMTTYGDKGSEGPDVAAFALVYTTDIAKVKRGIEMLKGCPLFCYRTTSLAPFKKIVNLMVLAEGYSFLIDKDASSAKTQHQQNLDATLAEMRDLAEEQDWPYINQLTEIENKLKDSSSELRTGWRETFPLGEVRLPLGPSQGRYACAFCHVGGSVPEHYYD